MSEIIMVPTGNEPSVTVNETGKDTVEITVVTALVLQETDLSPYYSKSETDTLLNTETTARQNADDTLQQNIDTETTTRTSADTTLQDNIDAEASARTNADSTLQNNIDAEASARTNADSTLQTLIDAETATRENNDDTLLTTISAEATSRGTADTTLQNNINAEASARTSADTTLQNNIDAEASARTGADTTLQNNIDAEASARTSADTTLQDNIDAEATTRASADNAIITASDAKYIIAAGKAGGQTANGGIATGESLILSSTVNATKGKINFGTSYYDEATNRLLVSDTPIASPAFSFEVSGASPDIVVTRYSDDTGGASLRNRKARGTVTIPAAVADGDSIGGLTWSVMDTAATFRNNANIRAVVNGTVGSNSVPLDIIVNTGLSVGTATEVIRFNSSKNVGIGTGATISAKLHVLAATEQLRIAYDTANYLSATINSTGSLTLNLTGTSPKFIFSKDLILSTLAGSGTRIMVADASGNVSAQTALDDKAKKVTWVRLTADQTTTSDIAADVPAMGLTVEAGKRYNIRIILYTACDNTGGVRFAFTFPVAGSALEIGQWIGSSTSATGTQLIRPSQSSGVLTASSTAFNRVANSSGCTVTFEGIFRCGSSTGGTLQLQFASSVLGQTSTVQVNSWMEIQERV